MTRPTLIAPLLLLFACDSDGSGDQPFTTDVRIDMENPSDPIDSEGTRMCVTEDGVVYVLWMDNRANSGGDKLDIWMNRSLNRGAEESWLPAPIKVNQGNAEAEGPGNVFNPDLYCNEVGVFVVWEDDRDGELENHQIYFNRSTDNGETFLPEDMLLERDEDGTSMSLEPKITGTDDGQELVVVWYDSLNGAYDIYATVTQDAGDSWRDQQRIDSDLPPGTSYSARPQVEMSNDAESIWVVWEDSRDGRADIYYSGSSTGGVVFEPDRRLDAIPDSDDGEHDSFEPQICSDKTSNVYVVWHDSANNINQRDILFNYSLDGGNDWFADARQLDSDGPGTANSLFPVCAVSNNVAHVAWQDNRNISYDVFYRRIIDGIPEPDEEQRLDGGDISSGNSSDVRIGIAGENIAVAWNDGRVEAATNADNGYTDLYYNFSQDGAPFADEDDFRIDSMFDGLSFKLDVNFQVIGGEMYAAWTDGRGATVDVYFQRWPLGDEADPPTLDLVQ